MSLSPSPKSQPPTLQLPTLQLPPLHLHSQVSTLTPSPSSSLSSLPMSPKTSASIPALPPVSPRSTPTTPLTDPNHSCPLLSSSEQPSLTRRTSVPIRRLPLLDLNALPSLCPTFDDLRTPRRQVEAIGTALSRFRPYLYVGSDASARDIQILRKHNITHILNLAGNTTPNLFDSQFNYLKLSPRDDNNEPIYEIFDLAVAFIENARRQRGTCAILCRQGISRSATVAIAYVMYDERISMDVALLDLRVARPIAAPNRGFLNALTRWGSHLKQGRRRPWLGVIKHCDETGFIAQKVRDVAYVGCEEACYVLERPKCKGVVVWRGSCCEDEIWSEGKAIATRIAERQKRSHLCFDRQQKGDTADGGLTMCCQGGSAEIEEEMRCACWV